MTSVAEKLGTVLRSIDTALAVELVANHNGRSILDHESLDLGNGKLLLYRLACHVMSFRVVACFRQHLYYQTATPCVVSITT